jgi:hypothetical protein
VEDTIHNGAGTQTKSGTQTRREARRAMKHNARGARDQRAARAIKACARRVQ